MKRINEYKKMFSVENNIELKSLNKWYPKYKASEKPKPMANHNKVLKEACLMLKLFPFPADKSQRIATRIQNTKRIKEII